MPDSINKRLRAAKAEIEHLGGTILSVERNKHFKIKFRNPQGVEQLYLLSVSPSDWRAKLDEKARLKRMMRSSPLRLSAGPEPQYTSPAR